MNRDQKAALVDELAGQIRDADAIFAVDYRGISVSDAAELRSRLRGAETRFRIVKNSLTERASDKAGAESLKELLEGPTALAFVGGDAALAAKALNDLARQLGTLEFKGGLMSGAPLSADEIRSLARLPARDVLHSQLVGTIASPLTGLVRTLNALISGIAIQLGQMRDQGLVEGEAPPSPAAESGEVKDEAVQPDARKAAEEGDAPPSPETEGEPSPDDAQAQGGSAGEPEAEAAEAPAEVAEEPAGEAGAEPEGEPEAEGEQAEEPEPETEASDGDAEESKEEA